MSNSYEELFKEWNQLCQYVTNYPNVPSGLAAQFTLNKISPKGTNGLSELIKAMKLSEKNNPTPNHKTSSSCNSQPTGKAIPLVLPNNMVYNFSKKTYENNGQERKSLVPNPEALKILSEIRDEIAVISVAGPCRSGKSYMMSKFVGPPDSFQLGHGMDALTHGIWMYSEPLKWELENGKKVSVILLDSEGVGSVNASGASDHQIFALALLLSSMFIYNSKQVFTGEDINQLDFIANISKHIQLRAGSNLDNEDTSLLNSQFPSFFWVLRDVLLLPQIGNKVVPIKEYFNKVVVAPNNFKKEGLARLQIRNNIQNLFGEFDVFDIPPPTTKKELLQNVGNNEEKLDDQFLEGMNNLISRVKKSIQPKSGFNGGRVTGSQYVNMLKYFLERVNTGTIPSVQGAWESACELAYHNAIQSAKEKYQEEMNNITKQFPISEIELQQYHDKAIVSSISTFVTIADFEKDSERFKEEEKKMKSELFSIKDQQVTGLFKLYKDQNFEISKKVCQDIVLSLQQQIVSHVKIASSASDPNYQVVLDKVNEMMNEYERKAKGSAKEEIGNSLRKYLEDEKEKIKTLIQNVLQVKKALQEKEQEMQRIQNEKRMNEERTRQIQKQAETERNALEQQIRQQREKADRDLQNMVNEERQRSNAQLRQLEVKQREEVNDIIRRNKEEVERMQQQMAKQEQDLKNSTQPPPHHPPHHPHHHHHHHPHPPHHHHHRH